MINNRVGQQLGNYRLTHFLGQGGFADVYLGEHIYLKTQAALKVLRMHLTSEVTEDFLKEAQTIARLEHPHIIRILECGVEGNTPFLVMNYAPNGPLRQRHPRGSRLSLESVLSYVQQLASALQYAHHQRLIHRDVKPENMLVGRANEVLLSDFGLVMIARSTGSQTMKEMAGTFPYMAPEQLQGKPRPASDQYALGIVVYEWLSGDRPFQGSSAEIASQHLLTPPPPLSGRIPGISPDVERVVFTALAKDPQQRFATVQEFARAFEQACQISRPLSFSSQSMNIPPSGQTQVGHGVQQPGQLQPSVGVPTSWSYPPFPSSTVTPVPQPQSSGAMPPLWVPQTTSTVTPPSQPQLSTKVPSPWGYPPPVPVGLPASMPQQTQGQSHRGIRTSGIIIGLLILTLMSCGMCTLFAFVHPTQSTPTSTGTNTVPADTAGTSTTSPTLSPTSTLAPTSPPIVQKTISEHLKLSCITCGYPDLSTVLDSIVIDQSRNRMVLNFTFTNNGTQACGSVSFQELSLEDPTGVTTQAEGPAVGTGSSFPLDTGQSLQEIPFIPMIPQPGVHYKLHSAVWCYSSENYYRIEVLTF